MIRVGTRNGCSVKHSHGNFINHIVIITHTRRKHPIIQLSKPSTIFSSKSFLKSIQQESFLCCSSCSQAPCWFVQVEFPKVQPQFRPPFLGFTKTAEIWNSRACMIGIIGVFIVEAIINGGILQVIGVDVGKGLNLPL